MTAGATVLVALALAGTGATPPGEPVIDYLQLDPAIGCARDVVLVDVDGDGRRDLVVATGTCLDDEALPSLTPSATSGSPERRLRVHLRRAGRPAFVGRPDRELVLVRDVVAWAVADVHPAPGREVVLLSAARAVCVFWAEEAIEPGYAALLDIRFLWQPADPDVAFAWQEGVRDLDGDGLDDLVLPEPDGYRVALQRRTPETGDTAARIELADVVLRPPPEPVGQAERSAAHFVARRGELRPSFVPERGQLDPLVAVHEWIGVPWVLDWDGDGDLDLAALSGRRLVVWTQEEGAFAAEPALEADLPDRRSRLLNPSYSVQLPDVDGDRKADVVLVASRTEGDDVISTLEVFRQSGGTDFERRADDKLRLTGFVGIPRFDDVDGDGRGDLTIGSLRPDLIASLASRGSDSIEAQLNLFTNRFETDGGRFQRPVALVHKLDLPSALLGDGWSVVAAFAHDVNGDGRRDLFLRTEADRLSVRTTRERGRGLAVGDPLWELAIAEDAPARLEVGRATAVFLVREPTQIVHVEFR